MTRRYRSWAGPQATSAGWLGRKVRWLPGSGYIDGLTGTVCQEETHSQEYGWCKVRPDGPEGNKYPDGITVHTTEVELMLFEERDWTC